MSNLGRAARMVAGTVLLTGVLVSCGRGPQELAVAGLPPAPAGPTPTTSFQGAVTSVDAKTGIVVVDVSIVWTPVIQRGGDERRVLIDRQTRWGPGPTALSNLVVGDEVQVHAVDAVEGVWPAVKVQLLDIE